MNYKADIRCEVIPNRREVGGLRFRYYSGMMHSRNGFEYLAGEEFGREDGKQDVGEDGGMAT